MSFWKTLFGRKSPAEKSPDDIIIVQCKRCARVFRVGDDAFITTMNDLPEVRHVLAGTPDMIDCIADAVAPALHNNIRKMSKGVVKRVKAELAQGIQRRWFCGRCRNPQDAQEYPKM